MQVLQQAKQKLAHCMAGGSFRAKSTGMSEREVDTAYWVQKAKKFADNESKITALALEFYHSAAEAERRVYQTEVKAKAEAEAERRVYQVEKEKEIMEHGLKEKTRLFGQRMVYERFLVECWVDLQALSPGDSTSVQRFEPKFPAKPGAKFPTKTTVDTVMRMEAPFIDNILSKILGTCTFPTTRQDLKYGVLSEAVHFPMGQELFVRDDEADDVKAFFKHLADRYSIPSEELNSNYISWFNK